MTYEEPTPMTGTPVLALGPLLKIRAICTVAELVNDKGFNTLVEEIQADPFTALQQFPFIGPVTGE